MEHVNIISKTEISSTPLWVFALLCITLGVFISLGIAFIYKKFHHKDNEIYGIIMIGFILLSLVLTVFSFIAIDNIEFDNVSSRYRYEATIDKENMTVEEYEEFIAEYNPSIVGDKYYWDGE